MEARRKHIYEEKKKKGWSPSYKQATIKPNQANRAKKRIPFSDLSTLTIWSLSQP
jgi:hypothetical protein